MSFNIFVVEDDEWYQKLLNYNLSLNPDHVITTFSNGGDMLKNLHQRPDLITLDYRLPDMTGGEVMRKIQAFDDTIPVIIISQQDDIEIAVQLLREGAYDYIVKTMEIQGRLLAAADRVRKSKALQNEVSDLRKEVQRKYDFRSSMVGDSPEMNKVFDLVAKAAETNISVLISGETGTGKEVVAKAIHYHSTRKNKPFVAVNVAAIPKDLIESELFGHEKGAFTGASARRIGKFEEADGGTLFLDEIGELDISLQVKLLRVLQEKEVVRIGGNAPVKTNCRIVTATHRNLKEAVKNKDFREDLYYRLFGLPIELPALRERGHDIILLAKKFKEAFCEENHLEAPDLTPSAQKKLLAFDWPGNVRQLKAIMELAVVTCNGKEITPDDLRIDSVSPAVETEMTLRQHNLNILKSYLDRYQQDIPAVAAKLDISVATIYRMLKELKDEEGGK
jgi:two-component system response regulator AtoC